MKSNKIKIIIYGFIIAFFVVAVVMKSLFFGDAVPEYMNDMFMMIMGGIIVYMFGNQRHDWEQVKPAKLKIKKK